MFYRLIGGYPTDNITDADKYRQKKAHKFVRDWTHFLRAAGVDGFVDVTGEGYIHPNEEVQAVFFGRQNIKVVDVLVNKAKPYQLGDNVQVFKKLRYFYINWARTFYREQTGQPIPKQVSEDFLKALDGKWNWFGKEVKNATNLSTGEKIKALKDTMPATIQAGEHKFAPGGHLVNALVSYWYSHVVALSRIYDADYTGNVPKNMEPVFAYYRTRLKVSWESAYIRRKFSAGDSLDDILFGEPETPAMNAVSEKHKNAAMDNLKEYVAQWMEFKEVFRKATGGEEIEDVVLNHETAQYDSPLQESSEDPLIHEAAKTDISKAALYMDEGMVILYDRHMAMPGLRRNDEQKVRPALLGVMDLGWSSQNKAYTVDQSWAKKGYGPIMYRLAMQYAQSDQPHVGLMPTPIRNQVSPEAENVWKNFYDGLGSTSVTHKKSEQSRGKSPNHDKEHLDRVYFSKEPIIGLEQALANSEKMFAKQVDPYGERRMTLVEAAAFHIRGEMDKIYNKVEEVERANPNIKYEIDKTLRYKVERTKTGASVKTMFQGQMLAVLEAERSPKPFSTIRGPLGPMQGDEGKEVGYYIITNNALAKAHPNVKMVSSNRKAIEAMYIKMIVALYKLNSSNPIYIAHKNNATNKVWDEMLKTKLDASGKIGYYSGINT